MAPPQAGLVREFLVAPNAGTLQIAHFNYALRSTGTALHCSGCPRSRMMGSERN
jgi:hypothetical protein